MKIDIGSGSEDMWYWPKSEADVLRLDCEVYDGVTKWVCPEPLPVEDKSVDEVYLGQFLIETSISDHKKLAKELNRVMKPSGKIITHCYDGVLGFQDFFRALEKVGWHVISSELVNFIDEGDEIIKTYMVKLTGR